MRKAKDPTSVEGALADAFGKRAAHYLQQDLNFARTHRSNRVELSYAERQQFERDMAFVKNRLTELRYSRVTNAQRDDINKSLTKLEYWTDII